MTPNNGLGEPGKLRDFPLVPGVSLIIKPVSKGTGASFCFGIEVYTPSQVKQKAQSFRASLGRSVFMSDPRVNSLGENHIPECLY